MPPETRPQAVIRGLASAFPSSVLGNAELAALSSEWTADMIAEKTGIRERRISDDDQYTSDLAVQAATHLLERFPELPQQVDFVLLCTQSPDYLLPTTACLLQERLGLSRKVGALDLNLGCSGYVYGLGLARGLIETGQARNVLFITADTYSKFIPADRLNVRTLFGDAAAATWIGTTDSTAPPAIGPFVYGTDGRGAENLIVKGSGLRPLGEGDQPGLTMNGPEIFAFTLQAVPKLVKELLQKAALELNAIDLFVFHQANEYMLKHLRDKLRIPPERFCITMSDCGNTVSSSIPVALERLDQAGRLKAGMTVMLVGFGVGYSWGATLVRWTG